MSTAAGETIVVSTDGWEPSPASYSIVHAFYID
jgi:hypothetical protein